jgi:glycosyltransferase involved in cell wall biosynthesis
MTETATPRVVAVWRSWWLPPSETFIRDHVRHLKRWQPLLLGLGQRGAGLDVVPDLAPFPDNSAGRLIERVSHRTGYRGVYDRRIRSSSPQLAHAHFGTDATRILPVLQRHRLPLIVTFHGYDVLLAPNRDATGRYMSRLRAVFDYAHTLLPVSEFLAERLLALGAPAEKVRTHALGIPVPRPLTAVAAPRHGLTFVGRLVPYKGVDDLLEAVSLLPESLRRATPVTIIGDGPARRALEAQARAIPHADIRFLGFLPPAAVMSHLDSSRVFAAPSKQLHNGAAEAYGLVYLEASRAGAPIAAYASGGVPSAVVDKVTGLLAPVGNVAELSANIARLLTDDDLAHRLGAAGQSRVSTELDIILRTKVLESLYDEVTESLPQGSRKAGRNQNLRVCAQPPRSRAEGVKAPDPRTAALN